MAALARSRRYIFARRRQEATYGGLLSPRSQLQFTRLLEVCQGFSGPSAAAAAGSPTLAGAYAGMERWSRGCTNTAPLAAGYVITHDQTSPGAF